MVENSRVFNPTSAVFVAFLRLCLELCGGDGELDCGHVRMHGRMYGSYEVENVGRCGSGFFGASG
jgi:hypothetical protein